MQAELRRHLHAWRIDLDKRHDKPQPVNPWCCCFSPKAGDEHVPMSRAEHQREMARLVASIQAWHIEEVTKIINELKKPQVTKRSRASCDI